MRNSYGLQWMAVVNQRDHPRQLTGVKIVERNKKATKK